MSAPQFGTYTPPEANDGPRFSPKDRIGHDIVIQVLGIKDKVPTRENQDGVDAINANVVDITTGEIFLDSLIFGGSWVDALRKSVGGPFLVLHIDTRKSKAGREYSIPGQGDSAAITKAQAFFATNPNAFVPAFGGDDEAPF